ncbi:acylphosphatase-1 [Pezoporus wallicus]|uniref:acylphosphatase-1 n=1 Tax=Pezoporus wallicus TaxID=35540 RepID=UPI0025512F21|nr:acylphosphatase-1 [Pezoporus wallicus]XP_061320234.1 acylphosphatase-1 [Pezoporus flaviventris]
MPVPIAYAARNNGQRGHAPNAGRSAPAQRIMRQLRLPLEEVEVDGGVGAMADGEGLLSVDYEVFGKVQGVFFRKYTQGEAKRLGLVGWVQNTSHGTVHGQVQGPAARVRELQEWLRKTGSPQSRISRAEFRNEKKIEALEHDNFQIVN